MRAIHGARFCSAWLRRCDARIRGWRGLLANSALIYLTKVAKNTDKVGQAGALDEPEITPQMVEAGYEVLLSSGLADVLLKVDRCTVAEVYRAMAALSPQRP